MITVYNIWIIKPLFGKPSLLIPDNLDGYLVTEFHDSYVNYQIAKTYEDCHSN